MTGSAQSQISFVTVTWNSAGYVESLLRSLASHLRANYEVIVVDNASTDGTPERLRSLAGPHMLVETGANLGFAQANNLGVKRARHEVTVLINPDCELIDDSLRSLAAAALETGTLCGPQVLNSDGTRQPSASPMPASWEGVLSAVLPHRLMPASIRRRCAPWTWREKTGVGWLTGACIAAHTHLLRSLGPFDPSDHLYGEDIDLGLRARRDGYRSLFLPSTATIVHHGDHAAALRFADAGMERSLVTRREVVRRNLGAKRERVDFASQGLTYGGRYLAKRALGVDCRHEYAWLAAWRRTARKSG